MKKLAIITSHPIQYNAPFFRLLAQSTIVDIKVFYTWGQSASGQVYDPTFQQTVQWDIPLLEGYHYEFIQNQSRDPGSHHFRGIINRDLVGKILDWNPDALLVYGWSFQSHLTVMRYFKGKIPVFFRGDSNLLDELPGFSFKKLFRRIFLKWVYHFVDTAFAVGNANRHYYMAHGLKEGQIIDAPHAIDIERFQANSASLEAAAEEWRASLAIETQEIVFLFAGKLEPKKSPEILVRAFLALKDQNAHLIIVGNGILENELHELSAEHPHIHFLPFQNQSKMPVVYRLANVFVLPSAGPGETWGLAVNEAMASGRPVIVSTGCGCAQDLVVDGQTGWKFEKNQIDDLTAKLKLALAKRNASLHLMGMQNVQFIQSHSLVKYVSAVESIMQSIQGKSLK